jgi:hypothetical protein
MCGAGKTQSQTIKINPMDITLVRNFRIEGGVEFDYIPPSGTYTKIIEGIDIEVWCKTPLEVILLGSAKTGESGIFGLDVQIDSPVSYIEDGKIKDVFLKAYYNGTLLSDNFSTPTDITLNEGYCYVGDYAINITSIEIPVTGPLSAQSTPFPPPRTSLLFYITIEDKPLSPEYDLTFTIPSGIADDTMEVLLHTTPQGYVKLDTPVYPIVKKNPAADTAIHYHVSGPLDSRAHECYIELDGVDPVYTMITDFVIHGGFLQVFDDDATYYKVVPEIAIGTDISAVRISTQGKVYGYDSVLEAWSLIDQLEFTMFANPAALVVLSDGFYTLSGSEGTATTGSLGDASSPFEDFSGTITNPEPFLVDVELEISGPGITPSTFEFDNQVQGSLNYTPVIYEGNEIAPVDNSPTLDDIETVSGVTFSSTFATFLGVVKIGTLNEARKAGPIRYIEGFPPTGVIPEELALLQGHTDLWSINADAEQNQEILDAGYDGIFAIANMPKNKFIEDMGGLTTFKAAKIHELAAQNRKLVGNLLTGVLSDLKLENGTIPPVSGSTFVSKVLSHSVNSCGCSDCQSNISPFAYLMDLIRYAAAHIDHTTSPTYEHGAGTIENFVTLISDQFLQPFGTLNVDCDTLHNEFCRVRLVTEVLEKWVTIQTEGEHISATHLANLAQERKQYLLLVYRTLLTQAGTSYEELRDVVIKNPAGAKTAAAQKLADRLGIPLYVPSTSTLTADRMWLTFNGGSVPAQELTAANLEDIFGYRDTQRDVLLNTPPSLMEEWQAAYLRTIWKAQDYALTNYSREGVIPGTGGSYKSNWKPIIDPDIIGFTDMTYLYESTMPSTIFARALWRNRKEDTDAFLLYCLKDNTNISWTAADITNRILRVPFRDIVSHVIEDDKVQIQDPLTSGWTSFDVINRKLVGINTDVILAKPTPAMFQPKNPGSSPTMRYNKVLNVVSISGTTTVVLTWPDPVLFDPMHSGYAKLESDGVGANSPFRTNGAGLQLISDVSFDSAAQVTLTLASAPNAAFLAGNINFVYEVSVPLVNASITDPEKIVTELFATTQEYTLLSPAPSGLTSPFEYTVWDDPGVWPSPIDAGLSDYGKMKQLYQILSSGNGSLYPELVDFIPFYLHMTQATFNRMMQLLIMCENYLASMYTAPRPTEAELYELASIFRNSAKTPLREVWVKEEIEYEGPLSDPPYKLMLYGQYFWKSIYEPVAGAWDPSLQTIPDEVEDITMFHVPIIDPELLALDDMWRYPETDDYFALYVIRRSALEAKYADYAGYVPADDDGFVEILNEVNTGSISTPFDISPYTTIDELLDDLNGNDAIKVQMATDLLWYAFRLNKDDFNEVAKVKSAYESTDPAQMPSDVTLTKAIRLLVTAYKRRQLYMGEDGWIAVEIEGSATASVPVKYYNVLKLRLAPGRTDVTDRKDWQHTLEAWNRLPSIQPDIVAPENINEISSTNWVYTTWTDRRTDLLGVATTIGTLFNSSLNAGTLFTNLRSLLNRCVGRLPYDFGTTEQDYLFHFIDLPLQEERDEDIRPQLQQLGISVTEYRFLVRVYNLLKEENIIAPSSPSSLLDTEYTDVTDIFIRIQSVNITFAQVLEEYEHPLILDQDFFRIFEPAPIAFPLTDLPKYNVWRSPYSDRKSWLDTLQTRIDREQAVKNKWKEVLRETEDRNLPLLRDALIRSLAQNCEAWQDAAERLAKTFFIETKDNCCVKHTRVSFAIETLQGLLFALQNGIYDDFVADYVLIAPNFKQEWEWIGSYATWRSAMFVYMYPENLLYPTLKRKQSKKFIELAAVMADANNLSPVDACKIGKEYNTYVQDIQNLEIICSTTTHAQVSDASIDKCCGGSDAIREYVGYFFGQSPITKKAYYSVKRNGDPTTTHSMWEEIPLPENTKVVGCLSLCDRYPEDWTEHNLALWLFYTYMDQNELKLAYIKKDLTNANSAWDNGDEIKLPKLAISGIDHNPVGVELCQHGDDWNDPTFLLNYKYPSSQTTSDIFIAARYFKKNNELTLLKNQNNYFVKTDRLNYITSIKMILTATNSIVMYNFVVIVKSNSLLLTSNEILYAREVTMNTVMGYTYIAAFQCKQEANAFIVIGKNPSGILYAEKIKVGFSNGAFTPAPAPIPLSLVFSNFPPVQTIYPAHTQILYDNYFALKFKNYPIPSGCTILSSPDSEDLSSNGHFALIPQQVNIVDVESADCISNMGVRSLVIQSKLTANLNPSLGTALPYAPSTDSIVELLYEAYYYMPMLLALDQQRRGQFESALAWYRSVYDYTNSLVNNRKVFYGLVLEQYIQNSYERASDWLLDPLNPHLVAQTRTNAYSKYTLMNIIQCLFDYADREFTLDTIETVPVARKLYTTAMELLRLPELFVIEDRCTANAVDCLDSVTEPFADSNQRTWSNLYNELQKKLASLGDAELIDDLAGGIAALLNAGDEDTYPEKFADAFELIETNRPEPPEVQDVTETLNGYKARVDEGYQYLSAIELPTAFNEAASSHFAHAIAAISGLQPDTVDLPESEDQIDWLTQEVPANSLGYTFAFARTDGQQLIPDDDLQFDPIMPRPNPYAANLNYNNAPVIINIEQLGIPLSYSPLIDFAFCMPSNPVYQALRLKGNLELYKIFNCRNIAGMLRELNVYPAATDSVTGIPIIGANGNLSTPAINNFAPSQYRFRVLIERAKQIAAQAQQMESLFLAALEKEDAANYEILRAKQDLETAKATIKLQDLRITQAQDERGIADIQLNKATFIQGHYNNLIASGLLDFEQRSLDNLQFAEILQYIAAGLSIASSVVSFNAATLSGLAVGSAASNIAQGLGSLASASSSTAGALSTQSSILATLASYRRREQEWQFQSQLANFDISLANQQIKISEDNVRIVTQEREIAVLNTTHAENTLDFLKNKFTNAELYNFMGNVLERSYSYMLNLSTAIARTAENQLYFERQERSGPFILDDYWVTPPTGASTTATTTDRRGLTGSARLVVDITRLDQYAFDTAKRKLQMTKLISLAQNFPSEFQQFRETGVMNFELTNKLFDYDFPGHYLRLINTVKTTVVGLIPVYDQIKATLTSDATSYTVIGGTTFQKVAIRRAELDAVALTAATNATGLFELQPAQSDFLNPFEGMGIESRWEFKMPKFSNRMDFDNIADILITVEYTALDSYQYRYQVLQELDNRLTFNRGFSFKNNFPDQWFELGEAEAGSNDFGVTIDLKRDMFPQGIDDLLLNTTENLVLYFVRKDGFEDEIDVLDFSRAVTASTNFSGGGATINGKLPNQLVTTLGDSPVVSLRLLFDNTVANRELFSEGKVTDILLLIPCKANLRSYPL